MVSSFQLRELRTTNGAVAAREGENRVNFERSGIVPNGCDEGIPRPWHTADQCVQFQICVAPRKSQTSHQSASSAIDDHQAAAEVESGTCGETW
jgi:hypothetical protein